MKKTIVLILALILTLSLAVPAAASVTSPTAPEKSGTTTAHIPFLISDTSNEDADKKCVLVPWKDLWKLSEDAQKVFTAAWESLADAKPEDMRAQYFFYYIPGSEFDSVNGSTLVVNIQKITEVTVKQFIDGKWEKLDAFINDEGTVTIKGVVEGPIAIFTK